MSSGTPIVIVWTWADVALLRDAINTSIANGTWQIQTVLFENQSLTLRSLDDAYKLLSTMLAYLGATTGGVTKYVTTSKGL